MKWEHLCNCSEEEGWASNIRYEKITTSSSKEPQISIDYFPVLVCEGCGKEKMVNPENWYHSFVREGKHFVNDLHLLLEALAYFMHLADEDNLLEFKGKTFGNAFPEKFKEKLE